MPKAPTDWFEREVPPVWARLAEGLYRAGEALVRGLYDRNIRSERRLPVPVISIGNLVVGGTGKTPVVRELAKAAAGAGWRAAILTRGYGGKRQGAMLRAGKVDGKPVSATDVGDEPLLLSRALPTVPVVVERRRFHGAMALMASGEPVDLFLLDDGFQHRSLHRDMDVVLVDANRPFGNGHCLPAGPLREPRQALRRADRLLVTGADSGGPPVETLGTLDRWAPGVPKIPCRVRGGKVTRLPGGEEDRLVPGLRLHAVAGVARPQRFRRTLEEAGANVVGWSVYQDHHRFSNAELRKEERAAEREDAIPVTTAKDAMRLENLVEPGRPWLVVDIALEIEGGWNAFLKGLDLPETG